MSSKLDSKNIGQKIYDRKYQKICYSSKTILQEEFDEKSATSGNRTRASRVAGENSTTEPTLLDNPQ